MGNPQLENGFIRIANEILHALCKFRLSGTEWRVLLVVWLKTYGWNKKTDRISLSQFSMITGLTRKHCLRAINMLVKKGVLKKGDTIPVTYSFIKHYNSWKVSPKKVTVTKIGTKVSPKKGTKVSPKKGHTKDIKDTNTKDTILAQSQALLLSFPQSVKILVEEYIELSKNENKTKVITTQKRFRLINELYLIYQQSEPKQFEEALKITVNNEAPNINYLKKVYKGQDKRQKVYQKLDKQKQQVGFEEGHRQSEQRIKDTQKRMKEYESTS